MSTSIVLKPPDQTERWPKVKRKKKLFTFTQAELCSKSQSDSDLWFNKYITLSAEVPTMKGLTDTWNQVWEHNCIQNEMRQTDSLASATSRTRDRHNELGIALITITAVCSKLPACERGHLCWAVGVTQSCLAAPWEHVPRTNESFWLKRQTP